MMGILLLPPESDFKNKIVSIVLCAGEGIRFKNITKNIPKPLLVIESSNNISILRHTINNFINLGLERILIVIGHLGKKIEEFVSELEKEDSKLKNKLIIIDSQNQYKLGPLYSFFSFIRRKDLFKKGIIYVVIPGDTIFEFGLLNEIFVLLKSRLKIIEKTPVLFYQRISVKHLKQQHEKSIQSQDFPTIVSIIDIMEKNSKEFLQAIKNYELRALKETDNILQIVPFFVFSYDFIREMMEKEKQASVKKISEIINLISEEGRKIETIEIDNKHWFHDIDNELDLIDLNALIKKSGQ